MATAFLAAKRSKDPSTQVGVCIVNEDKKIVGVGYNGMPIGCSDDEFPWDKTSSNKLETKYFYGEILIQKNNKQSFIKVEKIIDPLIRVDPFSSMPCRNECDIE